MDRIQLRWSGYGLGWGAMDYVNSENYWYPLIPFDKCETHPHSHENWLERTISSYITLYRIIVNIMVSIPIVFFRFDVSTWTYAPHITCFIADKYPILVYYILQSHGVSTMLPTLTTRYTPWVYLGKQFPQPKVSFLSYSNSQVMVTVGYGRHKDNLSCILYAHCIDTAHTKPFLLSGVIQGITNRAEAKFEIGRKQTRTNWHVWFVT